MAITEDYVSFETAKLLKEKGFEGYSIITTYDKDAANAYFEELKVKHLPYSSEDLKIKEFYYTQPTLQMAMKWLREVHHYYIQVMLDSWACGGHMGYYVVIQKTDSDFEMMLQDVVNDVFYQTYEQACEEGIKHCLNNII